MADLSVLQINVLGKTMSTGRTTREMHDYFLKNGIESHIATSLGEDCDDSFAITTQRGKYVDFALTLVTGVEGTHSKRQTRKLIKYIDEIKPSVVHLRVLHCLTLDFGALFGYLSAKKIPVVITLHDLWFMTGLCPFYTEIGCDKWKNGCGKCPALVINNKKPLFDKTAKMWYNKKKWIESIDRLAVVGVSEWAENEARKSLLKNAEIITHVYNWIDGGVFYPRDNAAEKIREKYNIISEKIILAVSTYWTFGDRKGLDYYLALADVLGDDSVIMLVGNFTSPVNHPKIIAVPPVTDADSLAEYYSAADVYLNLSSEESFGKAAAEAVSCGTPVIAYDSTANREIVPKNGGVVIKSREIPEITAALAEVFARDKSLYNETCVAFARENFDKNTNIEKYIEIYRRLL